MTDRTTLSEFNQGLCDFLDASPTPFHAVSTMVKKLEDNGYQSLSEKESWGDLTAGRYYVCRNDSSLIAFNLAEKALAEGGIRMVGAHTDSPCLKVKPQADRYKKGVWQLGVEVYGGALLNPWFDRDLSLAGRVSYLDTNQQLQHKLINVQKAVATIPSLAIHLDRDANTNRTINAQQHLPPIMMCMEQEGDNQFHAFLAAQLKQEHQVDGATVLDYEICLYDTQKAAITGVDDDFIASARLDNLLSCYSALSSLMTSDGSASSLIVCSDHEEVGSSSMAGADGSFLESVLMRLAPDMESYYRMVQHSMMISVDNAHAIHPNYSDKHDTQHSPKLNQGPVIKTNANQRYATNSETSALFRQLCRQVSVPVQDFVVRSDLGCGSTIGPMTAAKLGVKTLDIGVPTLGMHSIRELAGSRDSLMMNQILIHFFNIIEL